MMTAAARGGVTALASALLALTAFGGNYFGIQGYPVAGAIFLAILVFAAGWPQLLGVPGSFGAAVVIALAGLASIVVTLTVGEFQALCLVLAAGVIGAFGHQMLRSDGREQLVESLSASVTGVIVAVLASGWVSVITRYFGEDPGDHPVPIAIILVGACSVTAATLVTALLPGVVGSCLSPLFGAGIGSLIGYVFPTVGWLAGLGTAFALGVLHVGLHTLFGKFPESSNYRPAVSAALLPLLAAGIVVYAVARVIATVTV